MELFPKKLYGRHALCGRTRQPVLEGRPLAFFLRKRRRSKDTMEREVHELPAHSIAALRRTSLFPRRFDLVIARGHALLDRGV